MKSQEKQIDNRKHNSRNRVKRKYSPFAKPFVYKLKGSQILGSNNEDSTPDGSLTQRIRDLMNDTLHASISCRKAIKKDFFGLPPQVQDLLQVHRGIASLYEWQEECLQLPSLLQRRNLVYTLPTSGGKTLIAEILILKEIIVSHKNVLLILPFVSIVQEKIRSLSPFAVAFDFIIEEYAGARGSFPPKIRHKRNVVYMATIEKAHNLINSLIECDQINHLGLAVVDELHMISDGHRGVCLEMGLIKLLYRSASTQIIGMSATIGNLHQLAKFLRADVFSKEFRPVKLVEFVKLNNDLYLINDEKDGEFTKCRTISHASESKTKVFDEDNISGLLLEVIPNNSCLLFCPTKLNCENVCKMLSKVLPNFLLDHRTEEKQRLVLTLKRQGGGKICPVLQKSLLFGLAYHHAGLTSDERSLLEEAFTNGIVCCLCCTSTLAAGVNLPARRVILRSPYVARNVLSVSQYRQMIGRAGRAGLDSLGESIIICRNEDISLVKNLVTAKVPDCLSRMGENHGKGLVSLCLSCIASSVVCTARQLSQLLSLSLWSLQIDSDPAQQLKVITQHVDEILDHLINAKLIWVQKKAKDVKGKPSLDDKIAVTSLGKAAVSGNIDLNYAQTLYDDLKLSLKCLALNTHLHLFYLVTPYDLMDSIPFNQSNYLKAYSSLSGCDLVAANAIGASEAALARLMSGHKLDKDIFSRVHRFYVTLILNDVYINKSVWSVASKFDIHRGSVQNMLSSVMSFASCVLHFVQVGNTFSNVFLRTIYQPLEEFWAYSNLLSSFTVMLNNGLSEELVQLLELPGIKQGRAKLLYNAGYKTLNSVARATAEEIVSKVDFIPFSVARQIISSAKMIIFEKAESLREEAEVLSMGVDLAV